MDPFRQDPYDSDSGDDGSFSWPGGASEHARTLTEHAKALMRGDLEVSPLVTTVPPMPMAEPRPPAPGIPSNFRAPGGMQQVALKKRKIDPQSVARTFVVESQEIVLPPPPSVARANPEDSSRQPLGGGTSSVFSTEGMHPPAPIPVARASHTPVYAGSDMLAVLTTAASQSAPVAESSLPAVRDERPSAAKPGESEARNDGGIFDDADDEVNEGKGKQEVSASEPKAQGNSSKEEVIASVPRSEASPSKPIAGSETSIPTPLTAPLPSDTKSEASIEMKSPTDGTKRKSLPKTTKKVLTAKKERDFAESILSDKDDLLDVLPSEDCFFLGEQMWIFTVQQLRAVLGVGPTALPPAKVKEYHEMLVSKLSMKKDNNALSVIPRNTDVTPPAPVVKAADGQGLNDEAEVKLDSGERLVFWRKVVEPKIRKKPSDEKFPLDGPIQCLFPKAARNFLASAKVTSLYKFLSLKKTETGAICDLLRVWRRLCDLPVLSLLALAKHLLGISARVEAAITVIEPIDERNRRWMIDPIIVMTGAARDFLVDNQGIMTAAEFVDCRTKELALKLADWREKNGMVPLKGSGKVAMISGWKAAAREAIEAEFNYGKVLQNADLEAEAALEVLDVSDLDPGPTTKKSSSSKGTVSPASTSLASAQSTKAKVAPAPAPKAKPPIQEKSKEGPSKRLRVSTSDRQVQYALSTKLFLEDVLGEEETTLLCDAGVTTAAEFFHMHPDKEILLKGILLDAKKVSSDSDFKRLLDEWCDKLNDELEMIAPSARDTIDEAAARLLTKKAKTVDSNTKTAEKKSAVKRPESFPSRSRKMKDPFDSLSTVTKRFLSTIGITTAEAFLKTRTTDIAQAFVDFRISEGMPELKGLGAIASVSGWKANVRKAAMDMGKSDIVVMEPDNKSSWGPSSRNIPSKPKTKSITSPSTAIPIPKTVLVVHEDVLGGKPRLLFAVTGNTGTKSCDLCRVSTSTLISPSATSEPEIQYRFELSVRRPEVSSPASLFITYRGEAKCTEDPTLSRSSLEFTSVDLTTPSKRDIMADVDYVTIGNSTVDVDVRAPFCSNTRGTGFIFLSPYGVRPTRNQDLGILKSEIRGFVVDGALKSSLPVTKPISRSNTLIRKNSFGFIEYFLSLDRRIEKGQCAEVSFRELAAHLQSGLYRTTQFQRMHLLDEAFSLLSRSDLRELVVFLQGELLEATKYEQAVRSMSSQSSDSEGMSFKGACEARRRLHWVALRVSNALRVWVPLRSFTESESEPTIDALNFGPLWQQSNETKSLSPSWLAEFNDAMAGEVRRELLAELELDKICSNGSRKIWCPMFATTFDRIMDSIIKYYVQAENPSSTEALDCLLSCINSCLSSGSDEQINDFMFSLKVGDLTDGHDPIGDDIRELINSACSGNGSSFDSRDELFDVFACVNPGDSEVTDGTETKADPSHVVFRLKDDMKDDPSALNKAWYRERQWWIVMSVVTKAGLLLSQTERAKIIHPNTLYELKKRFFEISGLQFLEDARMEVTELPCLHASDKVLVEPHSYPLFLGLVWPKLRSVGWRLEAGDSPADLTFVAPDIKVIPSKRTNPWKQRRDIVRTRLFRETNRSGLGNLTKTTKRLMVSVIPHPEGDEVANETSEAKGVSTAVALRRFVQHVESQLDKDDLNGRLLASKVVEIVERCFNELAPKMASGADDKVEVGSAAAKPPPAERYSCDFLLRFLLVLPSILRQSDLPLQEINDCTEIIRELVDWMTVEYPKLLHKKYHPPKESYVPPKQPKQTLPELSQRLNILYRSNAAAAAAANDSKESKNVGPLVMRELILPEDEAGLTDFLILVLNQALPCRATEHDVAKKFRRVNVGFPGFVCRHCMGNSGEGRYFFSTIESLTTASTVFEKHIGKCKSVPEEVKAAVVDAKTRHVDQRKQLPVGSQQAYFNRLWDRLRASQIEGHASGTYVLEGTLKKDVSNSSESSEELEFRDHIALLDFVRTEAPWKTNSTVAEGLNQYYGCLDYGGRVFYTSSMPSHFTAEWLLRKVGPRPKRSKKKRLMPG